MWRTPKKPGGEKQNRIFVGEPIMPKGIKRVVGKRDVTILCPLSSVDVDHHPRRVNIRKLRVQGFKESQPAGVDRGKEDMVVKGGDVVKYPKDLFLAQNAGQSPISFGVQVGEGVPGALEGIDEKEFDAAVRAVCGWQLTICHCFSGRGNSPPVRFR